MQFLRTVFALGTLLFIGTSALAIDGAFDVTETWRVTLTYDDFGRGYSGVKVFSGTQRGTIIIQNGNYKLIDRSGVQWGSTGQGLTDRFLSGGPGSYFISGDYPFAPAFGFRAYGIVFLGCFVVKVPLVDGEVPAFFGVDHYSAQGSLSSLSGGGSMRGSSLTADVESTITFTPVIARPRITQQPRGQTVSAGETVLLTVEATGTPPLSYAWRKGPTFLAGQTGSTLTLSNVQRADAGAYSVIISNAAGRVISRPARISLRPIRPPWKESWDSSAIAQRFPLRGRVATLRGDKGQWVLVDTVSFFDDCGPVQNHAEILLENGQKVLKLSSFTNDGGCAENISVALDKRTSASFPIPLQSSTQISFIEQGAMDNPQWNGFFGCVAPPCGDTIHLTVIDNLGNQLVYVFQRAPDYVEHTTTRYTEVFLDPAGGTFTRNLFDDFARIAGPATVGTSIASLEFALSAAGWATLDELRIGSSLGP